MEYTTEWVAGNELYAFGVLFEHQAQAAAYSMTFDRYGEKMQLEIETRAIVGKTLSV